MADTARFVLCDGGGGTNVICRQKKKGRSRKGKIFYSFITWRWGKIRCLLAQRQKGERKPKPKKNEKKKDRAALSRKSEGEECGAAKDCRMFRVKEGGKGQKPDKKREIRLRSGETGEKSRLSLKRLAKEERQ